MSEDVTPQELAQMIADALKEKGVDARQVGFGSGGRFASLALRLPNGQEYALTLEEN